MNRAGLAAVLVVASALLATWSLLVVDPFSLLRAVFVRTAGEGRDQALISRLHKDPHTQDVTNGAHPLQSLRTLESDWSAAKEGGRFILIGNSQTMTVLLAPQEQISGEEERTYPDLLLSNLAASGIRAKGYRLSAPNLSYMEVLWYLRFLLKHPPLIPDQLIVQLNFETFRKTGIRDGMLELLQDSAFAAAVDSEANSSANYAATFQQAIDRYKLQRAKESGTNNSGTLTGKTSLIEAAGIGSLFETKVREVLDRSSTFRSRGRMKVEFLDTLYLARVHLLGITPTTKRSMGGAALSANVSSLEQVGELCRQNQIRLTFFNAPQNPSAPLYRTEHDRSLYLQVIMDLASKYAWRYFDFENSIPKNMWGVWIDGPDPIHFGRAAHHRLADLMFAAGLVQPRR